MVKNDAARFFGNKVVVDKIVDEALLAMAGLFDRAAELSQRVNDTRVLERHEL